MTRYLIAMLCAGLMQIPQAMAHNNPPQFLDKPDASRSVNNRGVTMVSSIAATPGGRLWATWYAGLTPGEDLNNYVVLATSGDDGKTWQEVLVADPDGNGPIRAFDPEIWMAPDGNLYWIWAQTLGHDGNIAGTWTLKITNPEEAEPTYEQPVRWADGITMCKPIVLSSGEWVLPVSTWRRNDNSARMVVSTDNGKTWEVRGAAHVPQDVRNYDEHMIVERKDGSLWMLVRTKYGIGESVSTDRGKTWSALTPSKTPHTSSRFFIHRLDSGNLIFVKHGTMEESTGRSHLTAFISNDDGKTWQGGLLLDERASISYPDGQQAADGTIYITYDRSRTTDREILLAAFTEADALSGTDTSGKVRLKEIISKGSGGQSNKSIAEDKRDANADGKPLQTSPAATLTSQYEAFPIERGILIFSDRTYTLADRVPAALRNFSLLQTPLNGDKTITCATDGMVYFLTPQTARNKDSQEALLLQQGFQKVALPELHLFGNERNLCTLYQKHCKAGETIRFGKWAVPLILTQPKVD